MCFFDRQLLFSIQKPSVTELLELLVLYRRKKWSSIFIFSSLFKSFSPFIGLKLVWRKFFHTQQVQFTLWVPRLSTVDPMLLLPANCSSANEHNPDYRSVESTLDSGFMTLGSRLCFRDSELQTQHSGLTILETFYRVNCEHSRELCSPKFAKCKLNYLAELFGWACSAKPLRLKRKKLRWR